MEIRIGDDGMVLSNAQLDCRLLPGELVVAFIKRENVLQASWIILKIAMYSEEEDEGEEGMPPGGVIEDQQSAPMRALILDGDGCTLVMSKRHLEILKASGLAHLVEVAPHDWCAFEFNLGHMVAEVPGVVNHLAKLMADDDISILHHSTYGSELFLVQQKELSKAISCIRKKVDTTLNVLLQERSSSVAASTDSEGSPPPDWQGDAIIGAKEGTTGGESESSQIAEKLKRRQWHPKGNSQSMTTTESANRIPPASSSSPLPSSYMEAKVDEDEHNSSLVVHPPSPASQLVLRVMPKRLLLVRIHKEYLMECSWVLTRLFLFDNGPFSKFSHRSPSTSSAASTRSTASTTSSNNPSTSRSSNLITENPAFSRSAPASASHHTHFSTTAFAAGASPTPSGGQPLPLKCSPPPRRGTQTEEYCGQADFGPLAFCEMEGEITLLLHEEDLQLFPMDAVVACPLRWTPIKLCGRRFDFHETGVVSAMSKVDAGVPILNVSTFLTNVTLVEGRHLEQTLDTLSEELDASIDGLVLGAREKHYYQAEEEEGFTSSMTRQQQEMGVGGGAATTPMMNMNLQQQQQMMMMDLTQKRMAEMQFSSTSSTSTVRITD